MAKFDEIFDDVVVNAKAAASAVSKKAATVYDASKHKITAAEIRGEINKKLKDVGKMTYKQKVYGHDLDEQIDKAIEEIKELKDNLDIINAHIDEIRNQKKCPKCEAKISKNSIYCNICGAKIEEEEAEAEEAAAEEAVETAEEVVEAVAEEVAEVKEEAEKAAEEAAE